MFEPIWQAVGGAVSGETAREYTRRIWEHSRWNSFDQMHETASEIARIMGEIGMEAVEVRQYPSDGVASYGGWVMPHAWDVEDASLAIAEPHVDAPELARYRDCPHSLMMYSAPTPPGGLVAEVVVVDEAAKEASWQGKDVAGKLVLIDSVGIEAGLQAFERGAVGLICDALNLLGTVHSKGREHLDRAVQWHNYTIPPWRWDRKGFGFSLAPAEGRRLRSLLARHPSLKLRADVRTRLYDGSIPLATGVVPGETEDEIAITAHLCEPGANDDSSGCGLGLEVARAVQSLVRGGKLAPLRRSLRLVFSFEVRGFQALLATHPHLDRLVAGIDLDMVGCDLSDARSTARLIHNFPSLPAYTDSLAVALARRLQRDDPLFRFRVDAGGLVDNLFGEPAVGAPMCVLGAWPDAAYHTSLDRIENVSPVAMGAMGRVAGTFVAFLASAGPAEAAWLARTAAAYGEEEVASAAERLLRSREDDETLQARLAYLTRKGVERLSSVHRLLRVCDSGEGPALEPYLERLAERVRQAGREATRALREDREYGRAAGVVPPPEAQPGPEEADVRGARALVPQRRFRGSLCFEALDASALRELQAGVGLSVGWGAPYWLDLLLFNCNGERSLWDAWQRVRWETGTPELARAVRAVETLARHGLVQLRRVG